MEGTNGTPSPNGGGVEELSPEARALMDEITESPYPGMTKPEWATFLARMFKEMDEEKDWLYSQMG